MNQSSLNEESRKIKMAMIDKGLSVTDIGKMLDVCVSYASMIINGRRGNGKNNSNGKTLRKKIQEILNISNSQTL